ncbi:DnaJ-domain-containing protein [Pleomassaria siparia CBS 279.74]|uniref:DnaJ-domain-containing protein n=1 Tax=Pleomassaria siparia CBS 279.74 TaxID=1314801 RepID=A0A6G1JYA5_9PLEO|nr:DnaJ-domain-containing protein [Pleomassaria siparia CBS 279.74]
MGASQSSGGHATEDGGANLSGGDEIKTSYYELLGIERNATEDEIKKAYRKKALELHPDRNHGDEERATALFAQIQSAHEVLSDRQERAWYDAHEGDILRGGAPGGGEAHYEHNMRVTTAEEITGLMGKFSGNVDFSDSPSGFYGFLRETFEQLAKEEQHAADYEGLDGTDYPSFGHKDDGYQDVVRSFYAMWNGFATKKTFAWMDKYRLSEAPDRRMRRLMEKENKRIRDDGIRDFNNAVRQLVLFVRRRDPRYAPNTEKTKSPDEIAKAQRAATAAQAARSRALHAAKMKEPVAEWTQVRDPDGMEEEEEEEEELEIDDEVFECVACHKTFKSEKQYDAHERSKKHHKAVYALKKKMQKENVNLNLDEDIQSSGAITPADEEVSGDSADASDLHASVEHVADDMERLKVDVDDKPSENDEQESESESQAPRNKTSTSPSSEDDDQDEDDEYASRSAIEARLAGFVHPPSSPSTVPPPPTTETDDTPSTGASTPNPTTSQPQPSGPKLGAAALKRAKKAAKVAEENASDLKFKCEMCKAGFPSKTQLFQHVRDQGHAAPVATVKGAGGGGKKGKRK